MGVGGDAGDLAEVAAEDRCFDIGVADCGAGGVRSVPVVVTGGGIGLRADELLVEEAHVAGADQLVVAGERSVIRVVGRIAEVTPEAEELDCGIRIEVYRRRS